MDCCVGFRARGGLVAYILLTQPSGTPLIGIAVGLVSVLAAVSAVKAALKRNRGK